MDEVTKGVVGGIVVAMIHKEMFEDCKTPEDRRSEITKTISAIGKVLE